MNVVGLRGDAHHFGAAPGHRPDIGIRQVVLVDHELLGGIDLGDRIWNLEIEDIGRVLQPLGVFPAPEHLAAIGALALEHAARIMQAMGQHVDIGVGPRHQSAIVPDDAIDLVERNSHGFSPVVTPFQLATRQPSRVLRRRALPSAQSDLSLKRRDNSAARAWS